MLLYSKIFGTNAEKDLAKGPHQEALLTTGCPKKERMLTGVRIRKLTSCKNPDPALKVNEDPNLAV
jgi:hypothetical protein